MAISGQIVKPGDVVNFTYSGDVQQLVVPMDGLYQLEVWGGSGGGTAGLNNGGKGGYSIGYKELKKGTILFIVVGQAGFSAGGSRAAYNGGGVSTSIYFPSAWSSQALGGGGGATHIATKTGALSDLKNTQDIILIVAGGGGGAIEYIDGEGTNFKYSGGTGGGINGGNAEHKDPPYLQGQGATQSNGYGFGQGGTEAGGGGLFGGYYGGNLTCGGGGGSGYIGGVPEITIEGIKYSPNTINGQNSGNGKAVITLIDVVKSGLSVYSGTHQTTVMSGSKITEIYAGDTAAS